MAHESLRKCQGIRLGHSRPKEDPDLVEAASCHSPPFRHLPHVTLRSSDRISKPTWLAWITDWTDLDEGSEEEGLDTAVQTEDEGS